MREHSAEAKRFYNSKAWRLTREAYASSVYYMCERCGDAGYIVHHIKHIDSSNVHDANVTLNWDNLENLCHSCHNKEHFGKNNETVSGLAFNMYGELVEVKNEK